MCLVEAKEAFQEQASLKFATKDPQCCHWLVGLRHTNVKRPATTIPMLFLKIFYLVKETSDLLALHGSSQRHSYFLVQLRVQFFRHGCGGAAPFFQQESSMLSIFFQQRMDRNRICSDFQIRNRICCGPEQNLFGTENVT